MDLNTLMLLVAVVDQGSFAEAARQTGVPKSTVSRKLRELEDDLGVRLIQRSSRRLGLTAAGERMLGHARRIADAARAAEGDLRPRGDQAQGTLRVTASVSLAERHLAPLLIEFLARHPKIDLELHLDPAPRDLIEEGIDVAIRVGPPGRDGPLIARRLGESTAYLCAAPTYLERHGTPETLDELREHAGIVYRPRPGAASFTLEDGDASVHRVTPRSRLVVNSLPLVRDAVRAGLGIGALPAVFLKPDLASGDIVQILNDFHGQPMWVYAAFPNRDLSTPARLLVEHLATHLAPDAFSL